MKEITYNEAVELMAFGGETEVYFVRQVEEAAKLSLPELRKIAENGATFYVPDPEEEPKEESDPPIVVNDSFEVVDGQKRYETLAGKAVDVVFPVEEVLPPKKRISIDKGKVMALKKAGWSPAKIADEMRCSVKSIYNIVSMMKG